MKTVSELMCEQVVTIDPDTTVSDAHAKMEHAWIRHLPVIEDGRVVGIISDRDLLRATSGTQHVCDVMTIAPQTVFADTPARDAVALMLQYRIGALPVVDESETIVGLVSETDLLFFAHSALKGTRGQVPSRRVHVEHALLASHLDRLGAAREPEAVIDAIRDLRAFLKRHFEREESDNGFFNRVKQADPALEATTELLRKQHGKVLELAERIEREHLALAARDATGVTHEVKVIIDTLVEHERREAELFRKALSDDD